METSVLRIGKLLFGDLLAEMENICIDIGGTQHVFVVRIRHIATFELKLIDPK